MKLTADRYTRLSRAYLVLAEKFQQLDIEHMALKQKVVPLVKALKAYQQLALQQQQEKAELTAQLELLSARQTQLNAALAAANRREAQLVERLELAIADTAAAQSTLAALKAAETALTASVEAVTAEKTSLQAQLQTLEARCQTLEPLAGLLAPESLAELDEAESQIELVAETLAEMEANPTPDLSQSDRTLLAEFESGLDLTAPSEQSQSEAVPGSPSASWAIATVMPLPVLHEQLA